MRTRTMILTGALLVTSAVYAQAQDTKPTSPAPAPAAQTFTPKFGSIDFGFRSGSLKGDEARFNRLRDLRDGGYVDRFSFNKETETTAFRAEANNVGYRDQRYFVGLQDIGKLKASFEWNSTPMFQAQARGFSSGIGSGALTIDDAAQQAIQNSAVNAETALAQFGKAYDIKSRRDAANFNMTYSATRDVDVKVVVRNTNRSGSNLQALGFGNSPGNMMVLDMGVPVDDRTTDVKTRLEWANRNGLLAVGYDASWFNQHNPGFTFDNPMRVTDSATAGPAFGRAALSPTNSTSTMNVTGALNLPGHSKATAAISYGRLSQDAALLANTTNSALAAAALERATAEGKVDLTSMVYGFNSRPTADLWLNATYRYYDYSNQSPEFVNQVVPGDFGLGAVTTSEPGSFDRKTFDFDASYSPLNFVSFNAGFTRESADRTFRIYERTSEDAFRVSIDSVGNQYVTARLKFENSSRKGHGFEEELLTEIGEQPALRHFDIAPRDRNRVTGLFTLTPFSFFDVNATLSTGRDKYPESGMGLQDNKNNGYSVGFDIVPSSVVNFGLNYGVEKYDTLQYSRTANPLSATDKTFLDPTRDWTNTINDKVKTWSANLDLIKAIRKTDVRLSYDISDGNTNYQYGLVSSVSAVAKPVQYSTQPKNRIDVGKVDLQYFVRQNVALGLAYWYEQYKTEDFALNPLVLDANIVRNPTTAANALTGFYSGYANRPYKANTGFIRMTYLW